MWHINTGCCVHSFCVLSFSRGLTAKVGFVLPYFLGNVKIAGFASTCCTKKKIWWNHKCRRREAKIYCGRTSYWGVLERERWKIGGTTKIVWVHLQEALNFNTLQGKLLNAVEQNFEILISFSSTEVDWLVMPLRNISLLYVPKLILCWTFKMLLEQKNIIMYQWNVMLQRANFRDTLLSSWTTMLKSCQNVALDKCVKSFSSSYLVQNHFQQSPTQIVHQPHDAVSGKGEVTWVISALCALCEATTDWFT